MRVPQMCKLNVSSDEDKSLLGATQISLAHRRTNQFSHPHTNPCLWDRGNTHITSRNRIGAGFVFVFCFQFVVFQSWLIAIGYANNLG